MALEVNVVAPLGVTQAALPLLASSPHPRLLNITSDAAVEAYEGWGGYGAGKAALEHLGAVLAVEYPSVAVWSVDPGDLRTAMHQEAYPGEDISDRPEPVTVVPAFLTLINSHRPSGRYRASELVGAEGVVMTPAGGTATATMMTGPHPALPVCSRSPSRCRPSSRHPHHPSPAA